MKKHISAAIIAATWLATISATTKSGIAGAANSSESNGWCGTSIGEVAKSLPDSIRSCEISGSCDDPAIRDATVLEPLVISVIVHVIRDDEGNGGVGQNVVNLAIQNLNEHYVPYGIFFDLKATRFHRDNRFWSIPICESEISTELDALKIAYAEDVGRSLNIFITQQDTLPSNPGCSRSAIAGKGVYPFDPEALLSTGGLWLNAIATSITTSLGRTVLTHEMGHCLGLWHVFHGISEMDICDDCAELVDRTDANSRGDLCSDTPAIQLLGASNCVHRDTTDCSGAHLLTEPRDNFMDLVDLCASRFTEQQAHRMHCWVRDAISSLTDLNSIILDDDFANDVIEPWIVESGSWHESDGVITGFGMEETSIYLPLSISSIFAAMVRTNLHTGSDRGLCLHSSEGDVRAELKCDPSGMLCLYDGVTDHEFAFANEIGDWCQLHVYVMNDIIYAWVNGELVGNVPLSSKLIGCSFNQVRLFTRFNSAAEFDDVVVYGRERVIEHGAQVVGSVDTPVSAQDVAISGHYAYVADTGGDLQVIDIEDPTSPRIVASLSLDSQSYDVTISGQYAYVATNWAGMAVVDISDPEHPFEVGVVEIPGYALGVRYRDGHCFVAARSGGLQIVNVSYPAAPLIAGSYNPSAIIVGVTLQDSVAYLSAGSFLSVDITDINNPALIGTMTVGNGAKNCQIIDNVAYIADSFAGLFVADVSNPGAMSAISTLDTSGEAWDIELRGDIAYLAVGGSGLQIVDISDPNVPVSLGYVDTSGHAFGLAISGDYAYVADGEAGLSIIWRHVYSPTPVRDLPGAVAGIRSSYPNPFNPSTTISFDVVKRMHVNLRVFDAQGRTLATLVDAFCEPGSHSVTWNGRTTTGRECAAGVYFARMENAGETTTLKMALIK